MRQLTKEEVQHIASLQPEMLDWEFIIKNYTMDEEDVIALAEIIDWDILVTGRKLAEDTIRRYPSYIDWDIALKTQNHINQETLVAIRDARYTYDEAVATTEK